MWCVESDRDLEVMSWLTAHRQGPLCSRGAQAEGTPTEVREAMTLGSRLWPDAAQVTGPRSVGSSHLDRAVHLPAVEVLRPQCGAAEFDGADHDHGIPEGDLVALL
jgi:hypothetical protein